MTNTTPTIRSIEEARELARTLHEYADSTVVKASEDMYGGSGGLYDCAYNVRASTESLLADLDTLSDLLAP